MRQVVETLRCCSHQAFPVTPDVRKAYDSAEPFELHGCILRATVLHLLEHRRGFFDPAHADLPPARSHIPGTQAVGLPQTLRPTSSTLLLAARLGCCRQLALPVSTVEGMVSLPLELHVC